MKESFVKLEYDPQQNNFYSVASDPTAMSSSTSSLQPLQLVFLTEDERKQLSPPSSISPSSRRPPVSGSDYKMPPMIQLYIGTLSVLGLFIVYRLTQK